MQASINRLKCVQCGLVNFASAEVCKRCGMDFGKHKDNTPQLVVQPNHEVPPKPATHQKKDEGVTFKPACCPSCGGDLQVPTYRDTVKCMYCGSDVIVREAIQAASGGNIHTWVVLAQTATEAGNNQEAYEYYNKILEVNPLNGEAWQGKAAAVGWLSTLSSFRLPEMVTCFKKAIELAPPDRSTEVQQGAALSITEITSAYYQLSRKHLNEYIELDNVWREYLENCRSMIAGLEIAHNYFPKAQVIIDWLIFIYTDNIQGVVYANPYARADSWDPKQLVRNISAQYEAECRLRLDYYIKTKQQLNPKYQPQTIHKAKASACFVATATMGSHDDPEVVLLREFRDEWLLRRRLGRIFVQQYYKHSPYFAELISKKDSRRLWSYLFIIGPSTWFARRLLASPSKSISHECRDGQS